MIRMIFEDSLQFLTKKSSDSRIPLLKGKDVVAHRYRLEANQEKPLPGHVVAVAGPGSAVVWDTGRADVNTIGVVVAAAKHIREAGGDAADGVLLASHGDVVVTMAIAPHVGDALCPSGNSDGHAKVHVWYDRVNRGPVFGRVVSVRPDGAVVARVTEYIRGAPREVRCSATGAAVCMLLFVIATVWTLAHFLAS